MAQTTAAPAPGATAPRAPSRLGQWNSAVTSYYLLVGASMLLLVLGLVMVLSSSSVESLASGESPYAVFFSQAQYALMGLPLMWLASRIRPATYQRLAWPLLGVGLFAQLLVYTPLGRGKGGNTGWIFVGGFSAQPSEALKLALVVWLGMILARKQPLFDDWKHAAVPALPVAAGAVGMVLLGHDLGTAIIMLILVAGALFVAGVPMRIFAGAGIAAAVGVALLATVSQSRVDRIMNWFTGECDVTAGCYQTMHGMQALATGGWFGLGLGQSREKWSYLPEAHNDFIFAIIGEELGLIGTLLVLALFGLLAFAMFRVIARHRDPFAQVVTGGVAAWIIGQALVNMGVVVGLLPVIGVPLPLVSAGGSALITTLVALGVVISFARTEPGAAEALAARPSVVRRSLAVIGRTRA
ncbi:putative lipid II flippase FtsW [Cellulomonas sp. IC4_254]|uniref:putative lipid II flippase FtsW n=1 Tax=Cellulomonas sp. IC4_254 TaxID=2714040 RepID=UPI0014218328|nr:putative lipid II flippase FtsW [Cellulomonas sp. IC4_254]